LWFKILRTHLAGAEQKEAVERAKYNVRNLELIEDGLYKVEVSQPPGGNRREILRGLILKYAGLLSRVRQPLKRMKIGDPVYLITDQLQTGAGIPGMICALQDSTVEVAVESAHGTRILEIRNCEDILPSNLYTHSILNVRLPHLRGDRA
jgi:hypothetical protein